MDRVYIVERKVEFLYEVNDNQVMVKDVDSGTQYVVFKTELQQFIRDSKKRGRQSSPPATAPSSPSNQLSPSLDPPEMSPSLEPPPSESYSSSSSSSASPVLSQGDSDLIIDDAPPTVLPKEKSELNVPRPRSWVTVYKWEDPIPTDRLVHVTIKLQEYQKKITAGVRTKFAYPMNNVLFFMTQNVIPRIQHGNVINKVIEAIGFVQQVQVKIIFAEMLNDDFLRTDNWRWDRYEITNVKDKKQIPTTIVVKAESDDDEDKVIQYNKYLKRKLREKEAKESVTTRKSSSLITYPNIFIRQFSVWTEKTKTEPFIRTDLFPAENHLDVATDSVKIFEFESRSAQEVTIKTIQSPVDPAWSVTFVMVEGKKTPAELVGIVVHHEITRVTPMNVEGHLKSYMCAMCKQTITGKVYACGHCGKKFYCGKKCAKAHWKIHKEESK